MILIPDRTMRLLRSKVAGWVITIIGIAVTTVIVGRILATSQTVNVSILYLLVVLGSAIAFGATTSIFSALCSVLVYDYFFVDPYGSFDPGDSDAWLEILLFLIVAVVSSQLAAQQRFRADEARRREQEATALYTLNSLIVSGDTPNDFVTYVFQAFSANLGWNGLALYAVNQVGVLEVLAVEGRQIDPWEDFVRAGRVFSAASTLAGGSSDPGTSYRLSAPRRQSLSRGTLSDDGTREPMFYPILADNRPIGVLEILRVADSEDLTETQSRFLQVVCQQFGLALDRARLHQEAAEAAALRRSEEVKTAFLNSVTHDLRTPLAMIKASAGSLRQRDAEWTEDEHDSFAASIERNVDRLDVIVGNLLDVSRIDAGMVHPERQYYPFAGVLDDVLGRLDPLLTGYPVVMDVPEDLPPVPIDYVAIDRVLSNLLENVTRHTPPGTRIVISAAEKDHDLVVSVADNGPGIPSAHVPYLFDRFYRGTSVPADARRGSGLGLAVVKGLVEAHGGSVTVVSRVGSGSTVTFCLPLGLHGESDAGFKPHVAGVHA